MWKVRLHGHIEVKGKGHAGGVEMVIWQEMEDGEGKTSAGENGPR